MSVYLKISQTDVSRFITENEYSVISEPVYDEESAFVNIYGERIRTLTGRNITIAVTLRDVTDDVISAVSAALESNRTQAEYSAPELKSAVFETEHLKISLDRVYRGVKYWTAELKISAFVREEGL